MTRQRIHLRTPALAYLVRVITVVFGAALVWYGAMVILLAVKVSPHTVNDISAYKTLYDDIVGLNPGDFTTRVRLIAGFGGFLAFLVLVYLALQELPRPYLARGPVSLDEQPGGETIAAQANPDVSSASGRLGDEELAVNISINRAGRAADALTDVQERVREALGEHELPNLPVNVTLTGYDRTTKRELA